MVSAAPRAELPGFVRFVAIPLLGLALTAFFVYRGFPYDRLKDVIVSDVGRATGARVAIATLDPELRLAGPGVLARDVRVSRLGETVAIDRVFLRPGWSPSWLLGTPAVYTEADAVFGSAAGVFRAGDVPAWRGEVHGLDLAQIPLGAGWRGSGLTGHLDAVVDLRLAESGPEGTVDLEGEDGTLTFATLPVPVPYRRLAGELVFGGEAFVAVDGLEFEGDLGAGTVTGRVARGSDFWTAPLELEIRLDADPSLHETLRALGARIGRNGSARVRVTGTPARPQASMR